LKQAGVNMVVDKVPFFVDLEGNVHEFPYYKQLLIHNIEAAHRAGLQYCMTLQDQYLLRKPGAPHVVPENLWLKFLANWNKVVLEYADLAEKYGVEMFAPLIEPDGVVGPELALEWGQEIVSQIRERYGGKILCRSGLGFEGLYGGGLWVEPGDFLEGMEDEPFNRAGAFRGYDYIGFTVVPTMISNWEYGDPVAESRYRIFLNEFMDYALMRAEMDGCKGVIATEFGEERVFEVGEEKLSGYFYWFDEPDLIEYWYKERLP
jgi:hypothetical protein